MRLALVIHGLGPGGAERVMTTLANAWAEQGEAVTLLTFDDGTASPAYALHPSVRLWPLALAGSSGHRVEGLLRNLRRARTLRRALVREAPDVVISFIAQTNVLVLLASLGLRFPVVVSERVDPHRHRTDAVWALLRALLYRRAAAIVVQVPSIADRFPASIGRRARVIPNPVPIPSETLAIDASVSPSTADQHKRLVGLGRLVRQKGFDLLIEAFARVAPRFPDWELVIWGEGEERPVLEALAERSGFADRIRLPGVTGEPFRQYAKADIFVLPSRYEGFPNALAEAMACGRAVIAADCPSGPADIVRDGIDGILVPPDDVEALTAALGDLMDDGERRAKLAMRAVEVTQRFSLERVLKEWNSLLGEVASKEVRAEVLKTRFAFGTTWRRFLALVDEERIARAERSLTDMLEAQDLSGRRFLDVGSGSGLFSLAARRRGARVYSFDYDLQSVACTRELKQRYFPDDPEWVVDEGSILDEAYVSSLGQFDIVYSWGVLHHTGAMWQALAGVERAVAPGGLLYVAIYNDQGGASRRWARVKQAYNKLPTPLRFLLLGPLFLRIWLLTFVRDFFIGRPFQTWRNYDSVRGMSPWRDLVDWVGGHPFEVAKPEEIFDFYRARGFVLRRLSTCGGGHGCNEFVFQRA